MTLPLAPDGPVTILFELDGYLPTEVEGVEGRAGETVEVARELKQIVGTVSVQADEGATVRLGSPEGEALCETPCQAQLPPGTWVLYVHKDGHRDAVRQVDVVADEEVVTAVELQPNTGSLLVDASERGALVEVDGEAVGFTPAVVQLPVGTRTVRVSRPGYAAVETQVDIATDEQVVLDDLELVASNEITAVSRRSERAQLAPSSVTIIGREEIEAFRYPTIYSALRGVRGFALTYDSIYGSAAVRGLGQANDFGNRLLILSDGAVLNDNILYQSFIGYAGRTDLEGIDRIEIVRGPGSILYGTGAVSGVVNLVPEPRRSPERTTVAVGAFDNHVMRGTAATHQNFGEDAGLYAMVSGATSDGREVEVDPRGPANPPTTLHAFDSFTAATTTGRLWFRDAVFQWYHGGRTLHFPTGAFGVRLDAADRNYWIDNRTLLELRYEPSLSDSTRLLTRVYGNRYVYEGIGAYGGRYLNYEKYYGNSIGAEARVVYDPGDVFGLQVGVTGEVSPEIDLYGEDRPPDAPVDNYLDEERPYGIAAVYGLMALNPVDAVRLTGGARIDYWSTFGFAVSPRASLVLLPSRRDVVKLMAGRAFRAPSIYELYYNIPGIQELPGKLLPETVWSGELELSHAFDEAWTGLVAGHGSLAQNVVETRSVPGGAVQYANSGEAIRIAGVDAEVRRAFKGGWMASAFYSWLDSRYADSLQVVPNVPTHNAGTKVVIPVAGSMARVALRNSLEAPRRIDLTRDDTTGWAVVSDLVLSGSVPERRFSYAIGVYNLFDMQYSQPLTDTFPFRTMPQQGRSLLATLSLGF
ncbi:MAG: TonB-dependent receptor [Myxococcota bacterium]